ncbi:MAG TPA: hypothetical protein VLA02_01325 [Reyranella sp.]|nr:hypothetical protein [Reyranella sp.]
MSTSTATPPSMLSPVAGTYQPKGMLIGGQWVGSASGARLTIVEDRCHRHRSGLRQV